MSEEVILSGVGQCVMLLLLMANSARLMGNYTLQYLANTVKLVLNASAFLKCEFYNSLYN